MSASVSVFRFAVQQPFCLTLAKILLENLERVCRVPSKMTVPMKLFSVPRPSSSKLQLLSRVYSWP